MHQDCNSSLENISVDLYRCIPRGLSHMFYTAAHQPLLPDSALGAVRLNDISCAFSYICKTTPTIRLSSSSFPLWQSALRESGSLRSLAPPE